MAGGRVRRAEPRLSAQPWEHILPVKPACDFE